MAMMNGAALVAAPMTISSEDETKKAPKGKVTKSPRLLWLTTEHEKELDGYFNQYESDIGIRSTFGAMVARMAGVTGASNVHEDPMPGRIALGCVQRNLLVHRALRLMVERREGHLVTVLWLLLGPRHPGTPPREFGSLGPIIHLTEAAEAAREQLALREGRVREEVVAEHYDDQFVELFWDAAGETQRLDERIATRRAYPRMQTAASLRVTARLEGERAGWREVMHRILEGRLHARLTALASADHETTTRGAIRWRLASKAPATRAAFIASATRDALQLKIAAASAYRKAREAIA